METSRRDMPAGSVEAYSHPLILTGVSISVQSKQLTPCSFTHHRGVLNLPRQDTIYFCS